MTEGDSVFYQDLTDLSFREPSQWLWGLGGNGFQVMGRGSDQTRI